MATRNPHAPIDVGNGPLLTSKWPTEGLVNFANCRKARILPWDRSGGSVADLAYRVGVEELANVAAKVRGIPRHPRPRHVLRRSFGSGRWIEIGVVDRMEVDCLARAGLGQSHIAVLSLGFPTVMASLVASVWRDGNFMPWIGNPGHGPKFLVGSHVVEWLQFALGDVDEERRRAIARHVHSATVDDLLGDGIECPSRRLGAAIMLADCLRFAWLHEFGHIILGHTSVAPVLEAPDKCPAKADGVTHPGRLRPSDRDRILTEFAADDFAGRILIGRRLLTRSRDRDADGGLVLLSAVSSALFGVLFHAIRVLGGPTPSHSYPPAWLRAQAILDLTMNEWAGQTHTADRDGVPRGLRSRYIRSLGTISQMHALYGEILGPIVDGNYEGSVTPFISDLMNLTRDSPYSRALRPWLPASRP